jgi:tetratricopeptide (TPR) repeat protein
MSRWPEAALLALLGGSFALCGQGQEKQAPDTKPAEHQEQAPPEEDEAEKPKEYSFNPLQAQKEVDTGIFYMHRGSYKGAVQRFQEATRWNPTFAEAYFLLGEAQEKQRSWKAAQEAYEKFLNLAADDKRAPEVRKKVEKLAKGKH